MPRLYLVWYLQINVKLFVPSIRIAGRTLPPSLPSFSRDPTWDLGGHCLPPLPSFSRDPTWDLGGLVDYSLRSTYITLGEHWVWEWQEMLWGGHYGPLVTLRSLWDWSSWSLGRGSSYVSSYWQLFQVKWQERICDRVKIKLLHGALGICFLGVPVGICF